MSDAKPPIEGMTQMPAYLHLPMMDGFWTACVSWALGEPEVVARFIKETGCDLISIGRARGLDAMVDKATGRTRDAFVSFCDWVTVNYWGVAGSEGKEDEE